MRKLFLPLALIASSLSVPALADVTFTPAGNLGNNAVKGYLEYIDAKYTKSGQPMIASTYDQEDVTEIKIYNADIENVATVTVPMTPSGSYQEVSYRVLEYNPYGPKGEYSDGLYSRSEALQVISENLQGNVSETVYNGKTIYYPTTNIEGQNIDPYLYIDYWTFGTRYPSRCYYLNSVEGEPGLVELVRIELWRESYLATGQWTDPEIKDSYSYKSQGYKDIEISDYNSGCDDYKYMPLTQTLFNDDADYEYIKELTTTYLAKVDESEYVKTSYYESNSIGFAICGSNGNEIQRVMFDDSEDISRSASFSMTIIEDKTYFTVRRDFYGSDYTYIFYTMAGGGSALQQVGEPIRVSVAPTVIRHDENLNIQLDDLHGEGRITVNDVAGRTVFNTTVEESGIHQIPARNFSNGMNIVTVETPKGRTTSKIIVK